MSNRDIFKELYSKKMNKEKNYNKIVEKIASNEKFMYKYIKWTIVPMCLIIVICAVFTFGGNNNSLLSSDKEENKPYIDKNNIEEVFYETHNYLSDEIRFSAEQSIPSASFVNDNTPSNMLNKSDAVAIISIISVDGINNTINPAVGASYGKLVINNVLYGILNSGDTLEYIKSGAIMSLAEWEEAQPEDARIKRQEMRKEEGIDESYLTTTYKKFHYANDPIVEEGKTYLAYLKFNESVGKYEIIGRENGLRELNIEKQTKVSSKSYNIQEYTIKNNITEEYESLNNYVNTNVIATKK